MTRREIREEIFKLLFERELIYNNINKRIEEVIEENNIKKEDQIEFLKSYVSTGRFLNSYLNKMNLFTKNK